MHVCVYGFGVCVCVCVHVFVCVCVHVFVYVYVHVHMCMYVSEQAGSSLYLFALVLHVLWVFLPVFFSI